MRHFALTLTIATILSCGTARAPAWAAPAPNKAAAHAPRTKTDKNGQSAPADVRRAVDGIFAPYISSDAHDLSPDYSDEADWGRPLYTASTTALIKKWRAHMGDEPMDSLSSASWLCMCQDWDQAAFRVKWVGFHQKNNDSVTVDLDVQPLGDSKNRLRLLMAKEGGRWLIEDMVSTDMPEGLVTAIRKQLRRPPGS